MSLHCFNLINKKLKIIYFHNLSRFDGILVRNHIITNRAEWVVNPLKRNGEIDQFEVQVNKVQMVFFDSLKLLPGSLRSLGKSLCP